MKCPDVCVCLGSENVPNMKDALGKHTHIEGIMNIILWCNIILI